MVADGLCVPSAESVSVCVTGALEGFRLSQRTDIIAKNRQKNEYLLTSQF